MLKFELLISKHFLIFLIKLIIKELTRFLQGKLYFCKSNFRL